MLFVPLMSTWRFLIRYSNGHMK